MPSLPDRTFEGIIGIASACERGDDSALNRGWPMLQFLHAGIIAACRQVVALLVCTLILLLVASITESFWLVTGPHVIWGYLLVAGGFALTTGKSIDQTAECIRHVSNRMETASRNSVAMVLVSQVGFAAFLLAVLARCEPRPKQ